MIDAVAAAETLHAVLAEIAAREILPSFRRLEAGAVRTKGGPLDLVTDADERAERAITATLADRFPDALVVGEEASAADPRLLEGLGEAGLAIVVDPIDGTANFAAGLPLFGSMAALVADGETIAAVIHDPICRDSAVAARGAGAWTIDATGCGAALRVASPTAPDAMAGKAAPRHFGDDAERLSRALLGTLAAWDYRCAAHEYRMAASGQCHYLLYSTTMPWDHLPGALILAEAGGHVARLDGRPYRPGDRRGGLLCAPDRASWTALRNVLFGRSEADQPAP